MTDLKKIKIAQWLFGAQFVTATLVLYLLHRGLSLDLIFRFLGFFYLLTAIFEYPTGVFGDYYSHRWSAALGYFLLALAHLLLVFGGSIWYYGALIFVMSLGQTFVSGSDTALLHRVSDDFHREYAQVKFYGMIISFAAASIGGFAAMFDLRIPLYLSSAFFLAAAVMTWSARVGGRDPNDRAGIFRAAVDGLRYATTNRKLFHLLVISAVMSTFFLSLKWIYNPIFIEAQIPVAWWGVLAGGAPLVIAMGTRIHMLRPKMNVLVLWGVLLIAILLIGKTDIVWLTIGGMLLSQCVRGYLSTRITIDMNTSITSSVRSSIFSLDSLSGRLGSTGFMFFSGWVLASHPVMSLMVVTAVAMLILSTYSVVRTVASDEVPA